MARQRGRVGDAGCSTRGAPDAGQAPTVVDLDPGGRGWGRRRGRPRRDPDRREPAVGAGAAGRCRRRAAMLEVDRVVERSVAELTEREDWGTPSARRAIARANREMDEGIEALERTLRERPGDPTRIDLLARAIEQRRGLTLEALR